MKSDAEKLTIAKKNYVGFLKNIEDKLDSPKTIQKYESFVFLENGTSVSDFYWTDNEITPTAVYRWLKGYRRQNIPRNKWAVVATISKDLYDKLYGMIKDPSNPLIIRDVEIRYY